MNNIQCISVQHHDDNCAVEDMYKRPEACNPCKIHACNNNIYFNNFTRAVLPWQRKEIAIHK